MKVLVQPLGDATFGVHLPPADFVPPEPEHWGDYADLRAACGVPFAADALAGYGELDVLLLGIQFHGLRALYCALCFPMGPPG